MCFKNCCQRLSEIGVAFQSILLLLIRLWWGFGFFQSGMGKLSNLAGTTDFFATLGIPFPQANAYLAGGAEMVGGALLIVGLFSRFAAIPLIFVMFVAYATAHHEALVEIFKNPGEFIAQQPFNFLFACLIILAFGPGRISIDYIICKLFFQKKDGSC